MVKINRPELWQSALPRPSIDGHKYDRGHTVVVGSETFTGATRLAAEAASRIGSGLVTVLSRPQAQVYRTTLAADIMIHDGGLDAINRPTTILAGPGGCSDAQAVELRAATSVESLVLDADAIRLQDALDCQTKILTPHEGEFQRYFGSVGSSREEAVSKAAATSKSIVVLKGAKTLIAAPDGRSLRNEMASPYLAKAGTGDVLAGMIAGLLAQGMAPFEASCAGVYMHGLAGVRIGPGLIPQAIIQDLRPILAELLS